jgi:hypothetical protein
LCEDAQCLGFLVRFSPLEKCLSKLLLFKLCLPVEESGMKNNDISFRFLPQQIPCLSSRPKKTSSTNRQTAKAALRWKRKKKNRIEIQKELMHLPTRAGRAARPGFKPEKRAWQTALMSAIKKI